MQPIIDVVQNSAVNFRSLLNSVDRPMPLIISGLAQLFHFLQQVQTQGGVQALQFRSVVWQVAGQVQSTLAQTLGSIPVVGPFLAYLVKS